MLSRDQAARACLDRKCFLVALLVVVSLHSDLADHFVNSSVVSEAVELRGVVDSFIGCSKDLRSVAAN